MDIGPVWARLSEGAKVRAWHLVRGGWHLEADRILMLELGDALEAKAVVAWLVRRKLHVHN